MYCLSCGNENAEGTKFCSSCGQPLPKSMTTPEQLDQLLKQGVAQVRAGKFAEGFSALQQVIKQSPQNAEAWLWLGYMAAMQKDRRTAERCFLRAQQAGHPKAQQALQALAKTHETTNGITSTVEYQPTQAIPERPSEDNASVTTTHPMYCSSCGYQNAEGTKFCSSCGQPLFTGTISPGAPTPTAKSGLSKGYKVALSAATIAVLCFFLLWIVVFRVGQKAAFPYMDSPERAAQEWLQASVDLDGNKLMERTCAAQQENIQEAGMWASVFNIFGQQAIGVQAKTDLSGLKFSTTSSSGNTARVRVTGQIRVAVLALAQSQKVDETWRMVKEEGKWKWCGQ